MATYARCGGTHNNRFVANLLANLPVKDFGKSVKNWQNYGREFGVQSLGPPTLYEADRLTKVVLENKRGR